MVNGVKKSHFFQIKIADIFNNLDLTGVLAKTKAKCYFKNMDEPQLLL